MLQIVASTFFGWSPPRHISLTSDILSGKDSDYLTFDLTYILAFHVAFHLTFYGVIAVAFWHYIRHSLWHLIWNSIRHSVWHSTWHIFWLFSGILSDINMTLYVPLYSSLSGILCGILSHSFCRHALSLNSLLPKGIAILQWYLGHRQASKLDPKIYKNFWIDNISVVDSGSTFVQNRIELSNIPFCPGCK